MSRLAVLVILIFSPTVAGAAETLLEQVARNWEIWDSAAIANYRFVYRPHGGWIADPAHVVVDNGVLSSITLKTCRETKVGEVPMGMRCTPQEQTVDLEVFKLTIPQIFDYVSSTVEAAQGDPDTQNFPIDIGFDSRFGFPTYFHFDDLRVSDESTGFEIAGFAEIR